MAEHHRKPNATIVCAWCGQTKRLYQRKARTVRFCSKPCANRWTVANRTANPKYGADHHAWKGDEISRRSGRSRAYRLYPEIGPCARCGAAKAERHHRDGNTKNNTPSNIEPLCRACHVREHRGAA